MTYTYTLINFVMKKQNIFFIVAVFTFFCTVSIFAQKKSLRRTGGRCKVVINLLRESIENDSIAIEIFKDEYKIVNMHSDDWLLKKNYSEIIQYFNSEEGGKYICRSKITRGRDYSLLDDR